MYNYHEKGRAPDLESVLADFVTYQDSSKGDCYSMQQQGTQFERDYSFADYQWESEWQPYCHTLISSRDHPLLGCDPRLTTSRYLAPIVRQFVKFRDMPEAKRKAL